VKRWGDHRSSLGGVGQTLAEHGVAGLLLFGAGLLLFGAGLLLFGAGLLLFGAGLLLFGAGLLTPP